MRVWIGELSLSHEHEHIEHIRQGPIKAGMCYDTDIVDNMLTSYKCISYECFIMF